MADGRDRKDSTPKSTPMPGLDTIMNLIADNPNPVPNSTPIPPGTYGTEFGSVLGGVLPPLAVGGIGAYTAKKTGDAYHASRGKGAVGGFKEGLNQAGPLKFVPLLGQAPAIAGAISGVIGGGRTEQEDERRDILKKKGIKLYEGDKGWEEKYNAVVNPNFASDFVGEDANKNWVNNKFASTRDESSLTGRDVDKYAVWSELFGDKYSNATAEQKYKLGDEAVKRGLLREHHGTLDVNADQGFLDFGNQLLGTPAVTNGAKRSSSGISPRKQDPKRNKVAKATPNLSDILPKLSQNTPVTNYDGAPTQQETTARNTYRDEILAQLMKGI